MKYKKKLIEVALPLEAINIASAREKSIRHGHPSTMHLWWARRPLAAARAVIFSQLVDDPSEHPDIFKTPKTQEKERQRLFNIIEDLVKWENTTNERVLQSARDEIWQSWRYTCAENADHPEAKELFNRQSLPAFHDPFAGGGALPLEGQRLGLESYASDLNPVAVLINKAMIEIPSKFANRPPVNPKSMIEQAHSGSWNGAQGLAEDVRYYGNLVCQEAKKLIGHLYPTQLITDEIARGRNDLVQYIGKELTVIAWIWTRTVNSPNPAFANIPVPLASTFMLATKANKEVYIEPLIQDGGYTFKVVNGKPPNLEKTKSGTKLSRGANFSCLMSGEPIEPDYIKNEGRAGRLGARLMAVVVQGDKGRIYLNPTEQMEVVAASAIPEWVPDTPIPNDMRSHWTPPYGLTTFGHLFTPRQLVALNTFSNLVQNIRTRITEDAIKAGWSDDGKALEEYSLGATAYSDAVAVYLGLGVSRSSSMWSSNCWWQANGEFIAQVFTRQGIPMVWDYGEVNPFSDATGNWISALDWIYKVMVNFPAKPLGFVFQQDAATQKISQNKLVSTDPPYYDNIGYADLSDFYYVWQRRSMKTIFPSLYGTLAAPKNEELVAAPYRQGGKKKAEMFFLEGMTQVMHRLSEQAHPAFPVTIYYAFKQSEGNGDEGATNTGWDTFLGAIIDAGFSISGTWPIRTERPSGVKAAVNALASSIVLVCRKRDPQAPTITRREFIALLKAELPAALQNLQAGNIAPVDLAQAAIGPGMSVYTRYSKVIDAEGNQISVRGALSLINQSLDESLAEQEGDFDSNSRFALAWFDQYGFTDGEFGVADVLARAKGTSVESVSDTGIALSGKGKVRLFRPNELSADWIPQLNKQITAWEVVHQLIRELELKGESAVAILVSKLGNHAEIARELCYRLYALCERKKRASDAMSYNGLVQSWPEIMRLSSTELPVKKSDNQDLFDQE